jgi:hypothetical protein
MKVHTLSVILLVMAIYFVVSVAAEIATDQMKHPMSMFARLLIGALVTGATAFVVKIEVP